MNCIINKIYSIFEKGIIIMFILIIFISKKCWFNDKERREFKNIRDKSFRAFI